MSTSSSSGGPPRNRKERRAADSGAAGKAAARDRDLFSLATEAAQKLYRAGPVDLRDTVFLFLDVGDEYALYIAASVGSQRDGVPFDDALAALERDHRDALAKGRRAVLGFWANGETLAGLLLPDLDEAKGEVGEVLTKPSAGDLIRVCAIADGSVRLARCSTR